MKRSRTVVTVLSCAIAVLLASRGPATAAGPQAPRAAAKPVQVVNTPTVEVANFPATQNVNVTNPAFQAPQPFQAKVQIQTPPGLCCDNAFVDVPDGKLLVIEYVSAWGFANGNQTFQFEVGTMLSGDTVHTSHYIPVKQRIFDNNTNEIAGQEVKLYADAGAGHVLLRMGHSDTQTAATVWMTISGHLVDR